MYSPMGLVYDFFGRRLGLYTKIFIMHLNNIKRFLGYMSAETKDWKKIIFFLLTKMGGQVSGQASGITVAGDQLSKRRDRRWLTQICAQTESLECEVDKFLNPKKAYEIVFAPKETNSGVNSGVWGKWRACPTTYAVLQSQPTKIVPKVPKGYKKNQHTHIASTIWSNEPSTQKKIFDKHRIIGFWSWLIWPAGIFIG